MTIVNRMVGAPTPDGATFAVRATTGSVRVAVADNPAMTGPVYTASQARDAGGCAKVAITGLDPLTRYWWQAEDGSGLDTSVTGTFLTHPPIGEPASFRLGAAGDAGLDPQYPATAGGELDAPRISNTPLYEHLRQRALDEGWLLFLNLGDWGYPDWGTRNTDTVANRRTWFDNLLAQSFQSPFCRDVPQHYIWDDHCFAGNDSNGNYANKGFAAQVYRERIPHYPLVESTGPIYHAFQIGRVLYLVADTRYNRTPNGATDNASKTMLGAVQKSWMESTLMAAAADDAIAAVIWVMSSQWMNPTHTDGWRSFQTERAEIGELFGDTGWLGSSAIFSADAHDSFIHSENDINAIGMAALMPVWHFAAIDARPIWGGPSDVGLAGSHSLLNNRRGYGQYGTVHIGDTGGDLSIAGTAWRGPNVINRYQFTTGSGKTVLPAAGGGTVLAL